MGDDNSSGAHPQRQFHDDDDTRPLLGRQLSSEQENAEAPRQFRAARREAAQNAVLHRDTMQHSAGICLFLAGLLLLAVPVLVIYVEVRSWYVLFLFGDYPCDQKLALWLLVRNLLTWTVPRTPDPNSDLTPEELESLRSRARLGASFSIGWLVVGCIWTSKATTCVHTNPELFHWVRFLTFFGVGVVVMTTTFPLVVLVVVMTYHSMVSRGWIKSPNAASDDAIDRLDTVTFSPALFQEGGTPTGGSRDAPRPPQDCCCCMEDFAPEKVIVLTPCGHYFHRECLQEWLRLARTCPLCRLDLDLNDGQFV